MFSDEWRVVVEELELTITATTREGKFRSRLNERTIMVFKGLDTKWALSPQEHTNVNRPLTLKPASHTSPLGLTALTSSR